MPKFLGAEEASIGPTRGPSESTRQGPVVGTAAKSLERLLPNARGIFLAEAETVVTRHGMDSGTWRELRLRVLSSSGVTFDRIVWVLALGNVKMGTEARVWREINPPEKRLKITADDFVVGRRYWFATADPSESRFYPQGVMNFWAADSVGVPAMLSEAIETDAYRWRPELRFPELGLTMGWLHESADSIMRLRIWKDGNLLWESSVRGVPGDVAYHRAYAYGPQIVEVGNTRPPSVEADSMILGKIRVRARLSAGNEYGVRPGIWQVITIYAGYTGRRLAASVMSDQSGGDELERVYVAYDPFSGQRIYERIQDTAGSGLKVDGFPAGTWRRKVERWIDPRTGHVDRELISLDAGGWKPVEHDVGLGASPVGCSSRD
jgi:hypothetical protein